MRRISFWICVSLISICTVPLPAQRGGGAGGAGRGLGGPSGVGGGVANPQLQQPAPHSRNGNVAGRAQGPGHTGGGLSVTQNTHLSSRLQPLLPAGMTMEAAAAGFKNEGQFLAAVHAAHNLDIPFDQLKTQMTGNNGMPLGKAVQKLRPELDSNTAKESVKLADRQAERDLRQASAGNKPEPFVTRLTGDTQLSSRLTTLLPPGMTLAEAAAGFKNQGQFIASLHVANNLNIPFLEIKDRVTAGESLGSAIHALKPEVDVNAAEKAAASAEAQARDDQAGKPGSAPPADAK